MKQIELVTVDDAVSVFNNWHQDILLIVDEMIRAAQEANTNSYYLETVHTLLADSPFTSNHFINTQTMYDNIEIIESIIND